LNTKNIIKIVFLIIIDIIFMAATYLICNKIFNANNLTIDPTFPRYIAILIIAKLAIYFIGGLYKDETRGIIFEIGTVTLANIIVFILLRFIFKVGVSTYLQLIALTVDIIVETISRSVLLSTTEIEEVYEDEDDSTAQVFDDPIDYSEELKLKKLKSELIENKNKQYQKQKEAEESLRRLKEMEARLREKETQLKNFENTLSLKELNIQKELEKLEREKELKDLREKEQIKKVKIEHEDILDGVLDNIKTIHTTLNERSKVMDMQEYNLMLKMYDITKKEIEYKAKEKPRKTKHLSDTELLEATYKKIGQKRKRTNPYIKQKNNTRNTNKDQRTTASLQSEKKLSEVLRKSPLINEDKKEEFKNANTFLSAMYKEDETTNTSNNDISSNKHILHETNKVKNHSNVVYEDKNINKELTEKKKKELKKQQLVQELKKKKELQKNKSDKEKTVKPDNKRNIPEKNTVKNEENKNDTNQEGFTKEELKIINLLKENNTEQKENINIKSEPKKPQNPVDLMFSEDDFDKIADLIDKL